jgi:hypothetical protein
LGAQNQSLKNLAALATSKLVYGHEAIRLARLKGQKKWPKVSSHNTVKGGFRQISQKTKKGQTRAKV